METLIQTTFEIDRAEVFKQRTSEINFLGRFEFLDATERCWPALLSSLLAPQPAIPVFRGNPPLRFSQISAIPECDIVRHAILKWAKMHNIRDSWLYDAALQTLIAHHRSPVTHWQYEDTKLKLEVFEATIGVWIPDGLPHGQSWQNFSNDAIENFKAQLEDYRRRTNLMWGVLRPGMRLHAEWTALWQSGYSPAKIRIWHQQMRQVSTAKVRTPQVSISTVQMRVRAFAKAIGLTRRPTKRAKPRGI
jgi:hypothetical protein